MQVHQALTLLACALHLAFAVLAWRRASHSRMAAALSVLFLDVFAWNFAELARELSGAREWGLIDRFFSTLLPALGFQVVVLFVGKARALHGLILSAYLAFVVLALAATLVPLPYTWWWRLLLGGAVLCMAFATYLLAAHARRSFDAAERARTRLIWLAISIATLVGSSDLWLDKVGLPRWRVSSVGMCMAMALFASAALRLELLGQALSAPLLWYAGLCGVLGVGLLLSIVHWFTAPLALGVLGLTTTLLLVVVAVAEVARVRNTTRERTQRLLLFGRWSEQLAHDLKNPLAALDGALQFLNEERRRGRSLDLHAEYLGFMQQQCKRLEHHVDVYQRLARVEPELSPCSINELVAGVLTLQPLASKPEISLSQQLAPDLPECRIDQELVATALENVLQNAYEALSAGGAIWVTTELAGDGSQAVVLSVEDDGPGIDPRLAERVTEPFVTTKPGGSGLGLAFAARVAQAHGGSLRIDSVLGRGTRVCMNLPTAATGSISPL
jgi:signal transduction histidine kinase